MTDFASVKTKLEKLAESNGQPVKNHSGDGVSTDVSGYVAQNVLALSGKATKKTTAWVDPSGREANKFFVDVSASSYTREEMDDYVAGLNAKMGEGAVKYTGQHAFHGEKAHSLKFDVAAFDAYALEQGKLQQTMSGVAPSGPEVAKKETGTTVVPKGLEEYNARYEAVMKQVDEAQASVKETAAILQEKAEAYRAANTSEKTGSGKKHVPVTIHGASGKVDVSDDAKKFAEVCKNKIGKAALQDVWGDNQDIRNHYGNFQSFQASVEANASAKQEAFGVYHEISARRMKALGVENVTINGESVNAATLAGAAGIGNVTQALQQDEKGKIDDKIAGQAADAVANIAKLSGVKVESGKAAELKYDFTAPGTGAKSKEGFQMGA